MRVIFMGSPEFAIPSLRALADAHEVVAVYSQPDRVRGRGRHPVPTPVKAEALELGIDVLTPVSLKDSEVQRGFAEFGADIACVAAYGLILPPEILTATKYGCVNVHASLLPRHRGAAPVHRAILEGDVTTGVSIMLMEEGLDTGPYATVVEVPVNDHDVTSLTGVLAEEGARALLRTLEAIESGSVVWTPQDDALATYAAKVVDADVALDSVLTAVQAARRVRASSPSARAKVRVCDSNLDVLSAVPAAHSLGPGEALLDREGLVLGFADGAIRAVEVRPEGRQTMSGAAFSCGARTGPVTTWESA